MVAMTDSEKLAEVIRGLADTAIGTKHSAVLRDAATRIERSDLPHHNSPSLASRVQSQAARESINEIARMIGALHFDSEERKHG